MTVRELIEVLRTVSNQDAAVLVKTQLPTDMEHCVVDGVDASRSAFGEDSDGAVWLDWSGHRLSFEDESITQDRVERRTGWES